MSAFPVQLNPPGGLQNGARVEVMQTDATRRRSRPMSAFPVQLNPPDDLEHGARSEVIQRPRGRPMSAFTHDALGNGEHVEVISARGGVAR